MNTEKMANKIAMKTSAKMDGYTIVAQQGQSVYLLADKSGKKGRVLSLTQGILFKPFNIQSILARGYWEKYNGSQDKMDELLDEVEEE
jgi:hypothetical protein